MGVNCGTVPPFTLFVHVFSLGLAGGIIQSRGVEVKRLVTVVTIAILPVGLVLLGLSDTDISVADTSIPDNEVATSVSKASNCSASATITITMTGPLNEQPPVDLEKVNR